MATVTSLVTKFSFQGSTAPLGEYNKGLGKSIGLLAGMGAALAASSAAVAKWSSNILQSLQPLVQMQDQTGLAVATIQELSFAAEQNNSSSQAMQSSLNSLSQTIGDAAQKGSEDFSRLGISVRDANGQVKQADQILMEVGDRFQQMGLSLAEQRSFAEALGIDSSLIKLLGQGRGEIERLREEARALGVLNPEQAEQVEEYNQSLARMRFGLGAVKNLVAVGLSPELEGLSNWIQELVKNNKEWIVDGIKAAAEFISELIDAIGRLTPFIIAAGAAFAVAKISALGFAGALGIVFSPAVLIAGAIVGIALVIDDLIVAFQGGESAIADFFQEFFGWDIMPVIQGIADAFFWLSGILDKVIRGDLIGAWDDFKETMLNIAGFIEHLFGRVFDWLGEQVANLLPQWAVNLLGLGGPDETTGAPGDSRIPAGGMAVMPGSTSNRVDQNVSIDIRTNDPVRAGRSVRDNLQNQLSEADAQLGGGGR